MLKRSLPTHFLAALLALWTASLFAQTSGVSATPIGEAKAVTGEVTATGADGRVRRLTAGSPIFHGDIIRTAEAAKAGIMMTDRSTYTLRPNTELQIKEYQFSADAPEQDKSTLALVRGGFRFLSGLIGKRNPNKVAYETPVATMGIRGTEGELSYEKGALRLAE